MSAWRGRILLCLGLAVLPASGAVTRHFVTEHFPPYTRASEGRAGGPMVDVLLAACARLDWHCEIEVLPWRRALSLAETGQVDGIFTVVDTPERRQAFRLSVPVLEGRYTLFARSGQAFAYKDAGSLKGRQIGVYGPSGSSIALNELLQGVKASVQLEGDNTTVLRKLAAGRYGEQGLALVNEAVALWLLREEGIAGLQSAGTVKRFSYHFGLVRQRVSEAEQRQFNEVLSGMCIRGLTAELVLPYALPASACTPQAPN